MRQLFSFLFLLFLVQIIFAQSFSVVEKQLWRKSAANTTIIRDNWGIPHIYAKTDGDAVFGLMYAQCEDDFGGVEEKWISRMGRRAQLSGEKYLGEDLYTAIFADTLQAKNDYKKLSPYYKSILLGFAGGLNFYINAHPQKIRLIKRYEPWFPLLRSSPSFNAVGLSAKQVFDYLTQQAVDVQNTSFYLPPAEDLYALGSNGWALAPSRTTSRHAFLLINPHGAITGAGQRLEMDITSAQGLHVYGAPFTGEPIMWQGFNETSGWARTVQYADMNDLYALSFNNPVDPLLYHYDNEYRKAIIKMITVSYLQQGILKTRQFKILTTHFGPVIARSGNNLLAIRDSTNEALSFIQSWDIPRAKNFAEFKAKWALCVEKPCTITYADTKGNIAYWHANMIPVRNKQYNWVNPVTTIGTAMEWKGIHKVDEVPHVLNPATGFIQNSNSSPWIISGKASPDSLLYPGYMSYDPRTLRSLLSLRLFNNHLKYSFDSFMKVALNNRYLIRYELFLPSLLQKYDALPASDSLKILLKAPVEVLRQWNYYSDTSSVATTLSVLLDDKLSLLHEKTLPAFYTYRQHYSFEYTTAESYPGTTVLQDLLQVIKELEKDFGTWQVPWGNINRLQRISPGTSLDKFDDNQPSLAVGAVQNQAGSLFDFASKRPAGSKLRYGTKGNTFVAVVDFGKTIRARTVLVSGQSADPTSPHYSDQAAIYVNGQLKEALFYKEDVLKHAERTYHPGE